MGHTLSFEMFSSSLAAFLTSPQSDDFNFHPTSKVSSERASGLHALFHLYPSIQINAKFYGHLE